MAIELWGHGNLHSYYVKRLVNYPLSQCLYFYEYKTNLSACVVNYAKTQFTMQTKKKFLLKIRTLLCTSIVGLLHRMSWRMVLSHLHSPTSSDRCYIHSQAIRKKFMSFIYSLKHQMFSLFNVVTCIRGYTIRSFHYRSGATLPASTM